MSAWTNVVNSKGKKSAQQRCSQSALLSKSGNDGVRSFLSTFKTSPCTNFERHDYRKCNYYHDNDIRRNPYSSFMYLPDDEDILSTAENVYHPMNYLTRICEDSSNCPYGRYCAKAHQKSLVRNAAVARQEYNEHLRNMTLERKMHSKLSLGTYTPTLQKGLATTSSLTQCSTGWNVADQDHNLPKCSEYLFELPLDSKPWFLINSSNKFFSFLREMAMKEGLFDPPSDFFVQQSKSLSSRVVKKLIKKTQSEINDMILERFAPHAFVEFSNNEIIICASNQSRSGDQIIYQVFEKLSFWIKQEGHDKFVDCDCCFDSFNLDEGLACRKGHFYCGGKEGCIGAMVKEQLERMQHQDNAISCSICQETIDTRSLAPHLSNETWLALEEARIDSKVKLRVEKLSHSLTSVLMQKFKSS
mmetsp:Transcript_29023/g.49474  ORF Transcript_29023/g.49474 Transcript_29023/m.49474 type:complete len:416 (-) Transcript_29023:142-1389(-)